MVDALVIEAKSKLRQEMGGGWEHFSPAIRGALIFERVMAWLVAQEAPRGGLIAAALQFFTGPPTACTFFPTPCTFFRQPATAGEHQA